TQVADDVLRELIYTNREFTGSEAKMLGFATHVSDDPLAKALELAEVIANKNPHAIRGAKRLCNMLADATDAEILQAESDEQVKVIRTPNQMEAVMAGMEKRKPNFVDWLDPGGSSPTASSKKRKNARRVVPVGLAPSARFLRLAVGAPAAFLVEFVEVDRLPQRGGVECALRKRERGDERTPDGHDGRQRGEAVRIVDEKRAAQRRNGGGRLVDR